MPIIINSDFKPFTWAEMLQPVQLANDQHVKMLEGLNLLDSNAKTWESQIMLEDPNSEVRKDYEDYISTIKNLVDTTNKVGLDPLTSYPSLLKAKSLYNEKILKAQAAITTRSNWVEAMNKAIAQDNTLMFDQDPSSMSLDTLVKNPNLKMNQYSGLQLTKSAADLAQRLAQEVTSGQGEWYGILDDMFFENAQKTGISSQELMDYLYKKSTEDSDQGKLVRQKLQSIYDNILTSSGVSQWGKYKDNPIFRERVNSFITSGLFHAIGTTKTQNLENYQMKSAMARQAQQQEAKAQFVMPEVVSLSSASDMGPVQNFSRQYMKAINTLYDDSTSTVDKDGNVTIGYGANKEKIEENRRDILTSVLSRIFHRRTVLETAASFSNPLDGRILDSDSLYMEEGLKQMKEFLKEGKVAMEEYNSMTEPFDQSEKPYSALKLMLTEDSFNRLSNGEEMNPSDVKFRNGLNFEKFYNQYLAASDYMDFVSGPLDRTFFGKSAFMTRDDEESKEILGGFAKLYLDPGLKDYIKRTKKEHQDNFTNTQSINVQAYPTSENIRPNIKLRIESNLPNGTEDISIYGLDPSTTKMKAIGSVSRDEFAAAVPTYIQFIPSRLNAEGANKLQPMLVRFTIPSGSKDSDGDELENKTFYIPLSSVLDDSSTKRLQEIVDTFDSFGIALKTAEESVRNNGNISDADKKKIEDYFKLSMKSGYANYTGLDIKQKIQNLLANAETLKFQYGSALSTAYTNVMATIQPKNSEHLRS